MNRRTFLKRVGIGTVGAVAMSAGWAEVEASGESVPQKPNVVLILVDDQGFGDLGYHGNPYVRTPHMDSFAREAVEFTQFYVSPVCSPTRASLVTGRYNFRTGVTDVAKSACEMDPQEVTIAESLRDGGYATGIFGKWHLGDGAEHEPGAQGFDQSLVHTGSGMGKYFDPQLISNGVKKTFKGYCLDIFTNHAIEFIRQNRARPFFVYLASNLIHTPLQVADELSAPFKAAGLDDKTALICGMLKNVDDNFGKVRAALKELGLEKNTFFIFLGDNGPCAGSVTAQRFMAGLHGLKGTPYENGIRVPSFMRWPGGFTSPAKIDRIAAHIDIMPTLLAACGMPRPDGVAWDGVNLMPLLRDPAAPWPDRTLFFQWDSGRIPRRGHAFAVRNQRYKLVQPTGMDSPNQKHICDRYTELCVAQGRGTRTIEGPPHYELYDISNDPGEMKDIAAGHADIVETMKRQYEAWFDDVCKRWPEASARP